MVRAAGPRGGILIVWLRGATLVALTVGRSARGVTARSAVLGSDSPERRPAKRQEPGGCGAGPEGPRRRGGSLPVARRTRRIRRGVAGNCLGDVIPAGRSVRNGGDLTCSLTPVTKRHQCQDGQIDKEDGWTQAAGASPEVLQPRQRSSPPSGRSGH